MSDWNKRYAAAERIQQCPLCGAEVVQLRFASGAPYFTNVVIGPSGQKQVISGSGNNFNFKPQHDCVKQAERALADARRALDAAEKRAQECVVHQYPDAPADDQQLQGIIARVRQAEKASAEQSRAQLHSAREVFALAQDRYSKLSAGQSIIPNGKPAIGRDVRVIKGRKVAKGFEGRIFWIGSDSYNPDVPRLGLVSASGEKVYLSAANVQVI